MEYKHAGFWIRFFAILIDSVILMIPMSIIFGFTVSVNPLAAVSINQLMNLIIIVGTVLLWIKWGGRTPGKKIMGIRILKSDYSELDTKTAIIRYFSYILSTITFGIGYLMVGLRKDKRGLHDLIAGTVVVYDKQDIKENNYQSEVKEDFPENKEEIK